MSIIKHLILFLFLSIIISCDNSLSSEENYLIATWINDGYENDIRVFKNAKEFSKDLGGYKFNSDHTLVDRKNIGWCGTPPVTFGNYDGSWEITSDNELTIIADYWGGTDTIKYEITKLNQSELKLRYIY